jgi:hypothetical protein
MIHALRPLVGIMDVDTLTFERLQVTHNQIHFEEQADLKNRDPPKRSSSQGKDAKNPLISHLNHELHGPISTSDSIADSKFLELCNCALGVTTVDCNTTSSVANGAGGHHCPSSGNCLAIGRHHLQGTTPFSTAQLSQLHSSDYTDSRKVPGTDQNIYPCAPISSEFRERYPQLVDFFKQAVDSHKILKHHTSEINYELRICGSTPSTAVASIVIFCAGAIFKHLRSLLSSRHIRRQYQLEKSFLLNTFSFAYNKHHSQVAAPVIVPFKIVFWREASTPTKRMSAMEQVVAHGPSFLTMCGSLVRCGDRTSTLGLLVSVNSKLYGLTVDHLFRNQGNEERSMKVEELYILPDEDNTEDDTEDNIEDDRADESWVDDVLYEDIADDQLASESGSVTSRKSHADVTTDHALIKQGITRIESINGHKVDSIHEMDSWMPYLDWALIEFDGGYFERPNAFYSEDDPLYPRFLTRASAAPECSGVHVFMISGVSGTRKGVILGSYSYIGGKRGESLCQVWNVVLSGSARKL